MSQYERQRQQTVIVASVQTATEAELVRLNLAANGIQAMVVAPASQYPSIDFVEGVNVLVSASDEETARKILEALDRPGRGHGENG